MKTETKQEIQEQIDKEIKEERKQVKEKIESLLDDLKKVEIDWDWLSDFDSSSGDLHNSIIWILSKQETLSNLKDKELKKHE